MTMLIWVVPYLIAGGVMWLVAYRMAPIGRDIPLSHAIIAVLLMGLCGGASSVYLKPVFGHWRILAEFVAHAIVVMAVFQLSLGRSLLTVLIYWLVMVIALLVITMLAKTHKPLFSNGALDQIMATQIARKSTLEPGTKRIFFFRDQNESCFAWSRVHCGHSH